VHATVSRFAYLNCLSAAERGNQMRNAGFMLGLLNPPCTPHQSRIIEAS
jgi:hypothetical protein